jgi:hypothetical protein
MAKSSIDLSNQLMDERVKAVAERDRANRARRQPRFDGTVRVRYVVPYSLKEGV